MNTATVKQLRDELKTRDEDELLKLCIRLANFKKENKELLSYLLFEAEDEAYFVEQVKEEMDADFYMITTYRHYLFKKEVRKILKYVKKYIRYSKNKETEVKLLLHFCSKLGEFQSILRHNPVLENLYFRQYEMAKRKIQALHPDLQYDYGQELDQLIKF